MPSSPRRCAVINYDRRGRGDSTDGEPFAVEREIEDLAALIDACGVPRRSGAGRRAARSRYGPRPPAPRRLSVYEVPFMVQLVSSGRRPTTASGSTSWSRPTIEAAR